MCFPQKESPPGSTGGLSKLFKILKVIMNEPGATRRARDDDGRVGGGDRTWT